MISPVSWRGGQRWTGVLGGGRREGAATGKGGLPATARSAFLKHYVLALGEAERFLSKHTSCFLPQSVAPSGARDPLVSQGRSQVRTFNPNAETSMREPQMHPRQQ